jgi:hypothetical protein
VVEGVTFNSFKNVFQASIKIDDQAYIKEFKLKSDAEHWVDIVKALKHKDLLKGHFATLKPAAATREATQKAFDSIVHAKNVFVPESQKTFQYDPANGKDVWSNMFSKFEDVPDNIPKSKVWLAQVSLQELTVQGFSSPVYADILCWRHKMLGYRGIQLLTHEEHEYGRGSGMRNWPRSDACGIHQVHLFFYRSAHPCSQRCREAEGHCLKELWGWNCHHCYLLQQSWMCEGLGMERWNCSFFLFCS